MGPVVSKNPGATGATDSLWCPQPKEGTPLHRPVGVRGGLVLLQVWSPPRPVSIVMQDCRNPDSPPLCPAKLALLLLPIPSGWVESGLLSLAHQTKTQ